MNNKSIRLSFEISALIFSIIAACLNKYAIAVSFAPAALILYEILFEENVIVNIYLSRLEKDYGHHLEILAHLRLLKPTNNRTFNFLKKELIKHNRNAHVNNVEMKHYHLNLLATILSIFPAKSMRDNTVKNEFLKDSNRDHVLILQTVIFIH